MVSVASLPTGTICSTSTTQALPHIAAGGLKLRAVLRNTALPVSSLQDIGLAIELFVFLIFDDQGAHAGFGVKFGDPATADAHPFGQGALGGVNAISISSFRYWHMNSAFSLTYELIIFLTWWMCNKMPIPKSSTPALFDANVRSLAPASLIPLQQQRWNATQGQTRRLQSNNPSNKSPPKASAALP